VGERENANDAGPFKVDDVVRKPLDRESSGGHIVGDSGHDATDMWPPRDLVERSVDGMDEVDAKPRSLGVVPDGGIFKFGGGLRLLPEGGIHRSVSRRRTRARTSSQDSPVDSPLMTRLARRSISRAQAASTSPGSSGGAVSRLASNSAATSARSSTGRLKASRSRACAREVMWRF